MEFRVLGPLEVLEEGRRVQIDRRRMRALLAFLLLHANEPLSADRLIDEVWGPDPPKTAAASLQNYVSRLRKTIGADAVISQPPGYMLRADPERFDLARFERLTSEARGVEPRERAEKLRAALALWRGPALDDLSFEPFARDEVGRLEEAKLRALEDCIDAELELGRNGDLVGELEALVETHPLRERFRAQLMRALYQAGRQADALDAFQAARDVLTEELGLEPGEELRTLQQAILRQDPSLGAAGVLAVEHAEDRRTVTVLLCDLVGSTGLAARLDPEAYRALLSRYFELVREPIERHGGTLEKFIGDAVLAVFGVPELHEDDALRAVRAAVDAQSALRTADIHARVGVSSGEVHVLSAAGEPLHVSGPPASIASRLEERALPGDVLVSEQTFARVRGAVRADRVEDAWRIVELVPGAPAFARRLDAPWIGRTEEVERLRGAYADARDRAHGRVVTVVGEAGIGKTRLLRELVRPLRTEAQILVGRCASYGEGATYLPLAEVVRQATTEPSAEGIRAMLGDADDAAQVSLRIAELTGLAEGPAAPGEAFWAVRRFVEALARSQPLVLVFDDIHWAEPTLLDLIEYLGEWTEAPVLVLCAARTELLESRPGWGGPNSTGFVVQLEPLAAQEMEELIVSLSEQSIDPAIERLVVEQSGGNPLYAEQLVALALESPEAASGTPPNLEALIASRLDHLDPGELAVLRRASVVGRRFTRLELADVTPGEEAARTDRHLGGLATRALIHPLEHVFAFHHVLVRDVAYRGIPKAQRAELHELAAAGLDRRDAPDEVVGYHFEQAYRSLDDIGRSDQSRELAAAGADRLGRAGIRAWKRADAPAAVNLLARARDLAPDRAQVACELAMALNVRGERASAEVLLDDVDDVRARLERAYLRSLSEPDRAGELLDVATSALPELERSGDERALGRAWYSIAHVRGGFYCEYAAMEDAANKTATCFSRAGWSASGAVDLIGNALYFGPKPVEEAVAECNELRTRHASDRASDANIAFWLGLLEALRGNFDAGRAHVEDARATFQDLGLLWGVDTYGRGLGTIEYLAGQFADAERVLRESCRWIQENEQWPVLATRAAELAAVIYEQGHYNEASAWVDVARESAGEDDLDAALTRVPVEAKLLARRGSTEEAEGLLRGVLERAATTDALNRQGDALSALGVVLKLADRTDEADAVLAEALALYERKGNAPSARRLRERVHVAAVSE